MVIQSEDDDDGDAGGQPPLEAVNAGQDAGPEGPLSGLNLLSALSTHEFASLENTSSRGSYYSTRNVGEGEATTGHKPRRGRPRLNISENEEVVEENYYESAGHTSTQFQPRGYRTTHEQITAQRVLQPPQRGRPSSTTTLVSRLTANNAIVRNEIAAARHNDDQISRAIDSILEREMTPLDSSGQQQGQNRGFINISPGVAMATAPGRPSRRDAVDALATAGGAGGGGSKSVKIIKVKVEKGTDLQQLAKQLTAKIKDERERQSQQRHPANSLNVIKTIAFPGMISAETLNTGIAGGYRSRSFGNASEGQVIEETVEEGIVMEDQAVRF